MVVLVLDKHSAFEKCERVD